MKETSVLVSDIDARFIWFEGEIFPGTAKIFARLLSKMNSSPEFGPIFFYIKGIGGDYAVTMEMAKCIERSPDPVCTVAHGYVGSGCFILTQAGQKRLAMDGTKFTFHPAAIGIRKGLENLEQNEIHKLLNWAKVTNAVQLSWFLRRGEPAATICELFQGGAVIGLRKAIKLKLIDAYYKKSDFYKDRRIARRLIKRAKQ